ncbi:septum site-determining protein MinC [Acidaminobacter sp. JC074]|uniref:septum site-determining protein MinC n=1 Tax=Acidaminobacter sp. JC074 TaxID=2530199 RepID=UPI001F1192C3|nr:septum site-determining protein MinC [Acidaminobacter sp. JC074]
MNKIVEFKGTSDGIVLQIRPFHCFEEVAECIHKKFEKSAQFFTGATIVGVEGEIGVEKNRFELYKLLTEDYKLNVISLDRVVKIEKEPEAVKEPEIKKEEIAIEALNYNEYDTKIVRKNLRSGMGVSYDGNIVVIGDVNPGAEIQAGGNVIVMGKLRGMVHAGKFGNKETYIIASKLIPTQIRIANIIARAPEDDHIDELKPEIAHIKSGHMSIEEL